MIQFDEVMSWSHNLKNNHDQFFKFKTNLDQQYCDITNMLIRISKFKFTPKTSPFPSNHLYSTNFDIKRLERFLKYQTF